MVKISLQREENSVHCENICLCKCKETNMKYLHQYVHWSKIILGWEENWQHWNVARKQFITNSVFLIGNEPFTCIQCTYITICSSLTPPPPIQCWFGLWSARLTSPNIEWGGGGGNGSLPTLNGGGGGRGVLARIMLLPCQLNSSVAS